MSSGDQGNKQDLQNLIFDMSKDSKKPKVSTIDYIGHCTFCMMGVAREELTYKNSLLFHSNCFEKQGKNFPAPNEEFLKQNSNTKVQLVELKNLQVRMMGTSNPNSAKPKSKRKTKKRSTKRRVTKRKRTATKRKKTKRRTSRRKISKNRRITKRRTSSKRKKTTRKTKRRVSRRTMRKTRRRR